MSAVRLTLLSKPGCHLCDDARGVVASVVEQLGAGASVEIEEKSILDDASLNDRYWDEIPVVLINDRLHNVWHVDPERLRAALVEALTSADTP